MVRLSLIIAAGMLLYISSVIPFVRSDLSTMAGYNINVGKLATKGEELRAVARLSNGLNQQSWWKLADKNWHDSAIYRYFKFGPLKAADMEELVKDAKEEFQISEAVFSDSTLMEVFKGLSTATYQMSKEIQGTGKIYGSMWTILFACEDGDWCEQGFLQPMVTIPKMGEAQKPAANSDTPRTYKDFSYATLWLNLTAILLANASPSFIGKLNGTHAQYVPIQVSNDSEFSAAATVYSNLPDCHSSAAVSSLHRSLLDAAYGLVPGVACIRFYIDNGGGENYLPILISNGLSNANDIYNDTNTLEKFISDSLHVSTSGNQGRQYWEHRPFEECSTAMLMRNYRDYPESPRIKLCDPKSQVCILDYANNDESYGGTCSGLQYLKFLHLVTSLSISCTADGESMATLDFSSSSSQYFNVSCTMNPTTVGEVCTATIKFFDNTMKLLFSPPSNWSTTEGSNTSEFSQAPHFTADLDQLPTCIQRISPEILTNSSEADFHEVIQIRATSYLDSYITEHHMAFTTANGPATDLKNFVALIVSTAISVLLATSEPFTIFALKFICKSFPSYLDAHKGIMWKIMKVGSQMVVNVGVSLCTFLPVWYLAKSEKDREDVFYTWDIGSSDQSIGVVNQDLIVRVVYLLSATSTYQSKLIIASIVTVGLTSLIVACCSVRRSMEVFARYALLMEREPGQHGNEEDKKAQFARALRAIDMTDAQYVDMKEEVERTRRALVQVELVPRPRTTQSRNDMHNTDPSMGTSHSSIIQTLAASTSHEPYGIVRQSSQSPLLLDNSLRSV